MQKVMYKEDAIKLSKELLAVISTLTKHFPICCVSQVEPGENCKKFQLSYNSNHFKSNFDYFTATTQTQSPLYSVNLDGRHFEVSFYEDLKDCGYVSLLPNYDKETYMLCMLVEKRADGSKKYVMNFGFDVEKMIFLEIFELTHYTSVPNLFRTLAYEELDEVESALTSYSLKS